MGPQQDDTLVNVLQSCEAVDLGQLFEPRDSLGVGYRTRVSLQNQTPVVYDYSTAVLAFPVNPTADDQFTRNDITLTRSGGSSYTDSVSTGPLSTQDPPNGVGAYTYSATVIAYADSQLSPMVTWMLATGTVNELRYPQLAFDLTRSEIAGQLAQTAGLDVGDYIQVTRPPSFLTTSNIDQLCWGFTETLNNYVWTIAVNAVPEDPYTGGGLPTW